MEPTLIFGIALGLFAYWIVKIWGELKSTSSINDCLTYAKVNGDKLLLSVIGAVLLILNGPVMPFDLGEIKGIFPAFIAGGSIPSMINNLVGAFKKPGA